MAGGKESVKRWRRNTKKRIVEALGGSCVVCGYSRCLEAMDCHHLYGKDISIGSMRAHPRSWNRIVEELRKCVLVCCRCHTEIHYGISELPSEAPSFDESFSEYRKLKSIAYDECPVCGNLKEDYKKVCSNSCSGKLRRQVDWDSVDLGSELERKSRQEIADSFGITYAAVTKRMKKLGIWKRQEPKVDRARMSVLLSQGYSTPQLAKEFGVSEPMISYHKRRMRKQKILDSSVGRAPGCDEQPLMETSRGKIG